MVYKKYGFVETLKECNEKYATHYKINKKISKAVIIYYPYDSIFKVSYKETNAYSELVTVHKRNMLDFIYYNITTKSPLLTGRIRDIVKEKEESSFGLRIEVWPSNKIRHAYLQNNYYALGVGHLGKSCMRSKDNQKSLNFYIKNNVKIVVVIDSNHKIHARALLWDNIKSTQRKKAFMYLDRVYTRSERLAPQFYDLAKEQGWKYYESTSLGNAKSIYYKDALDIANVCHFPYTDTFKYLYYKDGVVTGGCKPSEIKHTDTYITLTQTGNDGYFPELDPNRVQEAISDKYISKKDAVFVKRYDAYVLKKNIANINGAYYSVFDNKIVKTKVDGYVLKEDSVTEAITNEVISKNNAVQSAKYKGYIHKSNIIRIWDEVYHKSDTNIVCFDNKWYHISQCFVQDGNLIPKSLTLITYNLEEDEITKKLKYEEYYLDCSNVAVKKLYIEINTGEFILSSSKNKQYLKKFNNKWYIKQDFRLPDKKQLLLFGDKI